MSDYVFYYTTRQEYFRQIAPRFVRQLQEKKLSPEELKGFYKMIYSNAKRFGLIKEFRQLGLIY